MTIKQLRYIAGVLFGIYFVIVTVIMFSKPSNWSMMPYSWQQSWHPNYFLYFILIIFGIAAAVYGYKVFKDKSKN
jgi:uncharacterized metal-binding protein